MKIIRIQNGSKTKAFRIHALIGAQEFESLQGSLSGLCAFATKAILHPTSYTKTGKRNQATKYLLLPSALRRTVPRTEYNFDELTCGVTHYREAAFIIFKVPGLLAVPND